MSGTLPGIGLLDSRARLHNTPVNAVFELTHRCNLGCFHCYVVPERSRELDTAEVCGVLDQLAEAGTLFVTFTGGEILLRDDLFEILGHARRLHFAVRLFTNGTLIDEAVAASVARARPLDVGISIYGARAETHDSVTGVEGSHDVSIRALRLLHAEGVSTHMKCVLMTDNAGEWERIADLATNVGARVQFDPQLTPRNDGDSKPMEHAIDAGLLSRMVQVERLDEPVDPEAAMCAAGRDSVSISPSGQVFPCVQWPQSLGNLREHTFEDIWRSEETQRVRSLTMGRLTTCGTCSDLGYCSPCLGMNFIETGEPTTPSPSVCRIARARSKGGVV